MAKKLSPSSEMVRVEAELKKLVDRLQNDPSPKPTLPQLGQLARAIQRAGAEVRAVIDAELMARIAAKV